VFLYLNRLLPSTVKPKVTLFPISRDLTRFESELVPGPCVVVSSLASHLERRLPGLEEQG
jgi:hypothetical protein